MAREQLRPHDHAGVESIYVIQGTLSVHDGGEHALEASDAMYFDATIPHAHVLRRSQNPGDGHAIVVLRQLVSSRLSMIGDSADDGNDQYPLIGTSLALCGR